VKSLNEHKALILTKKNHALAASLLKPLTSIEEASHLCRLSSTSSQVTLVPVNGQKTTMANYTNRPPCNVIWPELFHIRWILAISVQENAAKQNWWAYTYAFSIHTANRPTSPQKTYQ